MVRQHPGLVSLHFPSAFSINNNKLFLHLVWIHLICTMYQIALTRGSPYFFPYTSQQTFMACYHTYTVQKVPSWNRSHVNLVWQMFQTRTSFANVLFFQEFKSDSACWTICDIREKLYDSECMDFLLCGVNEYFV